MAGSSAHVLLSLADMVFVGFFGTPALGAVGFGSFISSVYVSLFMGLSIAVQATVSRRKGAGHEGDLARHLNGAILLVVLLAPLPSALLFWLTPDIYALMNSDPAVLEPGTRYLRWLWLNAPLVGINMAFNGFWNATDRSTIYMRVVLLTTLINIPFNYIFMFGPLGLPAFGVEGAGLGTLAAGLVGTVYYFLLGLGHGRQNGFLSVRPSRDDLWLITRLAVPGGMQGMLDSLGLALMYRIVGLIGTVELAAYSVLMNLIGAVGLPAWGLGTAGATLVGQALGRGDPDDASRWAWDVVKVGSCAMAVLGIPLWLMPDLLMSAFIHESQTLAMASTPCRILGAMIAINGISYMMASILNGAGDVRRVMYVNLLTQYFVLLPCAWLAGPVLGLGFVGVWCVHQFLFRLGQVGIFCRMWVKGRWARIVI